KRPPAGPAEIEVERERLPARSSPNGSDAEVAVARSPVEAGGGEGGDPSTKSRGKALEELPVGRAMREQGPKRLERPVDQVFEIHGGAPVSAGEAVGRGVDVSR